MNIHVLALSVVVPVKNEQDSLRALTGALLATLSNYFHSTNFEIIFIDDGSTDRSWPIIRELTSEHPSIVHGLRLRRNFGKAVALGAGFEASRGQIIITMDADLQDDPTEIPRFLEALASGYDLVSGWKERRQDPFSKTLPSKLFNWITAKISGVRLRDFNCGFKAYRLEVIQSLNLYGELHRYIPVLAHDAGYKIGEISVKHHPRQHGVSKYGFERYVRGFIDLITVIATTRYLQKPGHLFGGVGVSCGLAGMLILTYMSTLWALDVGPIGNRPLLLLGILLVILSVQMVSLGVVSELVIKVKAPRNIDKLIAAVAPPLFTKKI